MKKITLLLKISFFFSSFFTDDIGTEISDAEIIALPKSRF